MLKEWAEDLNIDIFTRKLCRWQQTTDMKKCSSPVIREMQVKNHRRYHLTPVRIPIVKKTKKITSVGKDMDKRERLCALLVGLYITAFIMENSMDES